MSTLKGLASEDPYLTRQALAPILELTPDGVKHHLNKLQRDGYLERKEGRKTGRWRVLIIYLAACTEFEFRMDYLEDGGAQLVVTDQFRFAKHFGR